MMREIVILISYQSLRVRNMFIISVIMQIFQLLIEYFILLKYNCITHKDNHSFCRQEY